MEFDHLHLIQGRESRRCFPISGCRLTKKRYGLHHILSMRVLKIYIKYNCVKVIYHILNLFSNTCILDRILNVRDFAQFKETVYHQPEMKVLNDTMT